MKLHGIVCIAMLTVAVALEAQAVPATAESEGIKTYRFGVSVPVRECSIGSGIFRPNTQEVSAPNGARFAYVGEAAVDNRAHVIIQFLQWTDNAEYTRFNVDLTDAAEQRIASATALRATISSLDTAAARRARLAAAAAERITFVDIDRTRTFCVDKAIFDRTATRVYDRFSWDLAAGILLLPIKLRGGGSRDFDFSKDVTLGTVAGPRWRVHSQRDVFVSALVGAGITAVTLNSENTGGIVTEATDRAAVTITTGVMVEVNRFQLGLMLGWDHISNPNQNNWEYQGHRWLALGLGYTLLSAPPSQPAGGKQ
jgi:hypothetical protein